MMELKTKKKLKELKEVFKNNKEFFENKEKLKTLKDVFEQVEGFCELEEELKVIREELGLKRIVVYRKELEIMKQSLSYSDEVLRIGFGIEKAIEELKNIFNINDEEIETYTKEKDNGN